MIDATNTLMHLCEKGQKHLRTKNQKMLERNQEAQGKTNDVLGYHNHSYFQKYLKINKLDQINEYQLRFAEQELMKPNDR